MLAELGIITRYVLRLVFVKKPSLFCETILDEQRRRARGPV
jgi:hypothetical protein